MASYLLATYTLYLLVMVVVIGWAGWALHNAGRPFIREVFLNDYTTADLTNNLLLTGYYLVNIGYSFVVLSRLPAVHNWAEVMAALGTQIGQLVLLLAILHYSNLVVFFLWKRYHQV